MGSPFSRLVFVAMVCACGARPVTPPRPAQGDVDPALLRSLAMLASGREPAPAEVADAERRVAAGQLSIAQYVDALVGRESFAREVAPLAVLRHLISQNSLNTPMPYVLQHTATEPAVYYLDDPCPADQAVRVHPWWKLDDEILVCPGAYHPEVWSTRTPKGQELACLSGVTGNLPHNGGCGCGPNLFRCYHSGEQRAAAAESIRRELSRSVAYVAEHDLPATTVFTSNETFRDRNAEQVRRAGIIEQRRDLHPEALLRELAAWPADGAWAPREEQAHGHQAGILTSPQITFNMPDRRQRMAVIYDVVWCVEADSVGATPETLLAIQGGDLELKSAGWQELAARPICTNCHARLDYGMQFFYGYPHGSFQPFFIPELQQRGRGRLYARNIDDPRGDGELNPHGFAELALAQPEYKHCMARDFAEYALGNLVSPGQISEVEAQIRPATTLRDLMRASLLALVRAWPDRTRLPAPQTPPAAPPAPDGVAVTPALNKLLDDHCLDCHTADPKHPEVPDLQTPRLSRSMVARMLQETAFGRMPKDHPLDAAVRERFVDAFVAATWTGASSAAARAFYLGRMTGVANLRPEVIFSLIHQRTGAQHAPVWRMMENGVRSDHQQLTPGLIGIAGLAAIEQCRDAYAARADIDRCISDAVRLQDMAIDKGR